MKKVSIVSRSGGRASARPTTPVWAPDNARALLLACQPSSAARSSTRCLVSAATPG